MVAGLPYYTLSRRPVAAGAPTPCLCWDGDDFRTIGANTATSRGAALPAGGANVKGAWVELTPASPIQADGLLVVISGGLGVGDSLSDIALGAAGAETIIAPNLFASQVRYVGGLDIGSGSFYYLPIAIPAGTRIAARQQNRSNVAIYMTVTLVRQSGLASQGLGTVSAYGAVTANSGGTSIDPGAVANTKGAWTELTAATAADIHALALALGGQHNAARTGAGWLLDVGIGAAGAEVVLLPDLSFSSSNVFNNIGGLWPSLFGPIPCYIPAGTRIAARAQCSTTDATDRIFDLIAYGVEG